MRYHSSRFLRDRAENISILVTVAHLINQSISTNTVPYEIKRAKMVPLHENNSKVDVGNYRPVSILCILSKLLERVVYNQLDEYLTQKNSIYEFQSGFRSRFLTDTCLHT